MLRFSRSVDLSAHRRVLVVVDETARTYRAYAEAFGPMQNEPKGLPPGPILDALRAALNNQVFVECQYGAGIYCRRMNFSAGGEGPPVGVYYPREWSSAVGAVSGLTRRMGELFRYIEPSVGSNLHAFGHEPRQLLVLATTEVESSYRAILRANGYKGHGDATKDFVKLAAPLRLGERSLRPALHPDLPEIAPFRDWDVSRPTQSLEWYDAYNAVKHDRESNFHRATVLNAVTAVAAAYVLVWAQFGQADERSFLGLGEFRAAAMPSFSAEERYVPPGIIGRAEWSAVNFFP
jgi:hypothetical protein